MPEAFLLSAVRTPIGSFGGVFRDLPAAQLGAVALRAALERADVDGERVDEVILGNVLQAGQGQNPARQAALAAGLPERVPAMTVNMVCASGLRAVALAAQAVRGGEADIVVAGGTESMSTAPYLLRQHRFGQRLGHGEIEDTILRDGLLDAFGGEHMGCLCEGLARRYDIGRNAMDAFAAQSQQRAAEAIDAGRFSAEITPVDVPGRKGETTRVDRDEHPRPDTTLDTLARLRPAFAPDGVITAGNASGINDGAAALVIAGEKAVSTLTVAPLARVVTAAWSARDPASFGVAPAGAIKRVLERASLTLDDIDLIEANEAFAVQSLALQHEVGWDPDRVNVNGGAIALGHPIGASGARVLVTLLHELQRRNGRYGLATLCAGGGMGIAMVVERG